MFFKPVVWWTSRCLRCLPKALPINICMEFWDLSMVVTWCLSTYIGLRPYMVNVYIKERINNQTTICAGRVMGNTMYLGSWCSTEPHYWPNTKSLPWRYTPSTLHRIGGIWKRSFHSGTAHQMLSVHTTLQEFENASITGHFRFVFEENSGRGTSHTIMVLSFPKCSFLEIFSVHTKTLSRRFKFVMLSVEGALL